MGTRKVISLIGVMVLVAGFCLPWVQPNSKVLSGLDISLWMFDRPGGIRWDTFPAFLIVIPLFAFLTISFFSHTRRIVPVIFIVLADLLFASEYYVMGQFLDDAFYGLYIFMAGLAILNTAVVSLYFKFW